jgi:hypothetical protein
VEKRKPVRKTATTRKRKAVASTKSRSHGKSKGGAANLKPFVAGFDPRRNLNGRPKDHDALRDFIREIASDPVELKDGTKVPRLALMIANMMASGQAHDHSTILEHAWGKVPQEVDLNFSKMTDAQLRDFIENTAREIGLGVGGSQEPGPEDKSGAESGS